MVTAHTPNKHTTACAWDRDNLNCATSAPHKKTTLKIGITSSNKNVVRKLLDQFQNDSDEFNVRFEYPLQPNYYEYRDAQAAFCNPSSGLDIVMIDDPWLPDCAPNLADLTGLLTRQPYRDEYIDSLLGPGTITDPKNQQKLVALPFIGNVFIALHKQIPTDLQNCLDSAKINQPLINSKLTTPIQQALSSNPCKAPSGSIHTIQARLDTNASNVVETFIQLLYALGCDHRQMVAEDGKLLIPKHESSLALGAMKRLTTRLPGGNQVARPSALDIIHQLREQQTIFILGWANWGAGYMNNSQDPLVSSLHAQPIVHTSALQGTWFLAVPSDAPSDNQALAAKLIHNFSSSRTVQHSLLRSRLLPTIGGIQPHSLQPDSPFIEKDLDEIQFALRNGRPRPRTPYWTKAEDRLMNAIVTALSNNQPKLPIDKTSMYKLIDDVDHKICPRESAHPLP